MVKLDWKKTLKKAAWSFAFVIASGLVAIAQNDARWLMLVPFLEALRNVLKVKLDVAFL